MVTVATRAVALAFVLAACGSTPISTAPIAPPSDARSLVGTPAPPFALVAISGADPADLARLAGDVVVVDFWATWCAPCAAEQPRLDAWQAAYRARGLHVVGLTSDDRTDIARYLASHAVDYTVAQDDGDQVATAYRVVGLPTLVVIDRTGMVRYVDVGGRDLAAVEAAAVELLDGPRQRPGAP